MFLTTPRLQLRYLTEADAPLLFDLDSDPDVTRFTGPGFATLEEYRLRIANVFLPYYAAHPQRGCLAVDERVTGEFVGWYILRPSIDYRYAKAANWNDPSEIEIGYRFRKKFWGQGLATEGAKALAELAFQDAKTSALVAIALVNNRASTRVMEKIGMTEFRRCELPDEFGPAVIYRRLRS